MVTLGCLATGFTPSSLSFSWSQNGTDLTDSIQYPAVQTSGSYTGISQIRVKRQDWSQSHPIKCVVNHAAGNRHTQFQPPVVVYQLPTLKVGFYDEGNEVSFSCFAKDFSPKEHDIKWLKNGEVVTNTVDETETVSDGRKDSNGTRLYSAASFLKVHSTERSDDIIFTCVFEGKGENGIKTSINSSVPHKTGNTGCSGECPCADVHMNLIDPTLEDLFSNRKGAVICQIDILQGKVEKVYWMDEQGVEMSTASLKNKKGKFNLTLDITYDEWNRGVRRYCVVEHQDWIEPMKKLYEKRLGGQPQRPSVFMLPPLEHTRKEEVTLTCFVKDFFPKDIFVSWLVDDDEADSNKFRTTKPVEKNGLYSVYGQLTISLDQWKKKDVGYSCVVYHESMANTTKSIVRSIGYNTLENTNMINLNMNVP